MNSTKRIIALAVVVSVMFSVFAFPVAALADADISYDTGAGNMAGDDTDVISSFNADEDDYTLLATEVDNGTASGNVNQAKLNVSFTDADGAEVEHYEVVNESVTGTASWVSSSHTGAIFNISHDSLETVPMGIDENVTVNFTVEFQTDDSSDNIATDSFDVEVQNQDNRSVMYLENDTKQYNDTVTVEERDPAVWEVFTDDKPDWHTVEDDRSVSAGNTTVFMYLAEDDMGDDYTEQVPEPRIGSLEDGDPIWTHGVWDDGENQVYYVFYNEVNTDFVDEDADTYAVYDDSDDVMEIHIGDDYDADSVDFEAVNHNPGGISGVGFSELRATFGITDAIRAGALPGVGALTLSLIVFGSVKRRRRN